MTENDLLVLIAALGDNETNLRLVREQLATTLGVIPFVGAGLSIPFDMPGWGGFLIDQARRARIEAQIQARLARFEYEEAAEDLLAARTPRAFHDAIGEAFGDHHLAGQTLNGAVAVLPRFARGPVITTNFDHVLERVFTRAHCAFEYVTWGAREDLIHKALVQNRPFLLKLHGDVDDRTDRILTRAEYALAYCRLR